MERSSKEFFIVFFGAVFFMILLMNMAVTSAPTIFIQTIQNLINAHLTKRIECFVKCAYSLMI